MKYRSSKKGFTLVEMAIVMVIIGILIGIGAGIVGPLQTRVKRSDTSEIINADTEAVISYTATNRRIPDDSQNPNGFSRVVRNPNDAWGKPLLYIMDPVLTAIPAGATDAVCGRRTTAYTICRDAVCTAVTNIPNVAFVIASGAENYNMQTGITAAGAGGCPAGQTCIKIHPVDTANIDDCTTAANCPGYDAAQLLTRQENYDDLVKWITLDELRTKIGCQGGQLQIVNNELPYGFASTSPYTTTFYPQGGVPFSGPVYKWCIEVIPPTGTPTTNITPTPSASSCWSLAEDSTAWTSILNRTLTITSTSLTTGVYKIIITVRDNNDSSVTSGDTSRCSDLGNKDNCNQKTFVLTINP